jgi:Ulp1 family protease
LHVDRLIAQNAHNENPEIYFEAKSFNLLKHHGWLNQDCVSTLASFLACRQSKVTNYENHCGVFDSQAFLCAKNGFPSDYGLYHWAKGVKYWKWPVWVFPIHCNDHWVAAIVSHYDQKIYMYNSFGQSSKKLWEQDIEVCDLCSISLARLKFPLSGHSSIDHSFR